MKSREFHWQLVTFFRLLFASHLIYSGAAYVFFGWVPSAFYNPESPVGQFMVALDDVGLYAVVKHVELLLGLLALANRFVPAVAVAELPITFIIAYLNIVVEGPLEARHYYTGIQELTINVMLLLGYGAYYRSMLGFRSEPRWLWEKPDAEAGEGAAKPSPFGTVQFWGVFAVLMSLILAASWFMGSPDRRLPPRDWLPPLAAFVLTLISFRLALPGLRERYLKAR